MFGEATAEGTIKAMEAFFREVGAPVRLGELKIPAADIPKVAANAAATVKLWGMEMKQPEIEEILRAAL